jgi:hypothetical protein
MAERRSHRPFRKDLNLSPERAAVTQLPSCFLRWGQRTISEPAVIPASGIGTPRPLAARESELEI